MSKFIIGDIHGNFDTLQALIKMLPEGTKLSDIVLVGDLIDRGPKSREVIQWCIDNNIDTVKGNHEEMMVDWSIRKNIGDSLWLLNGGDRALDSYKEVHPDEYLKGDIDWSTFDKHCDWADQLPYYLEFEDVKDEKGRHLVVSHSNIGNVWRWRDSTNNYESGQFQATVTWGRPHKITDVPSIYNVIGHTPQPDGPRIKSFYANVDTGCFYSKLEYFRLTALQFPEMIVYEHENIDHSSFEGEPYKKVYSVKK